MGALGCATVSTISGNVILCLHAHLTKQSSLCCDVHASGYCIAPVKQSPPCNESVLPLHKEETCGPVVPLFKFEHGGSYQASQ